MRQIWTLESGINTTNEEIKKFFRRNKFFFIYEKEGKLILKSLNTDDELRTSSIKEKLFKDNGYARIKTQNTTYHFTKA